MQKLISSHPSVRSLENVAPNGPLNSVLSRREFNVLAATGLSASSLAANPLYIAARNLAERAPSEVKVPLDLAEWSYFWLGVERADLARGTVVNGKQMFVEYMIPSQVKHPYPIPHIPDHRSSVPNTGTLHS